MAVFPEQLSDDALAFLAERHLATLTSIRGDGSPHVVPVGFSWDSRAGLARVIASASSQKARLARAGGRAALCQVDGARWLTMEGDVTVSDDPGRVSEAVTRYTSRYRRPRENPTRVAIEVVVDRVLLSRSLAGPSISPPAVSDVDQLLDAERRLQRAQCTSDVAQLEALVHPTATFVGPDGGLVSRAADLEAHRTGALHISSLEERTLDGRIHDGVGITVLLAALRGTAGGQPFEAELRYTRTWVQDPSGWRVITAHASLVQG